MTKLHGFCAGLLVCIASLANGASTERMGQPGNWAGTLNGAAIGDKIYTVETGGALYETDGKTGAWKQLGKPEFADTVFLFAVKGKLVSIEKNGNLYIINPADGSWEASGKPGDWANTIAGAVLDSLLYTVEAGGALYETDPVSGTWKQIGKNDFANTRMLFSLGGGLFSIEKDGSMYLINPADGSWVISGQPGGWAGIVAGTMLGDKLYTVDDKGSLYETDPAVGSLKALGNTEIAGIRFLLPSGNGLRGIDGDGNLYFIASAASPAAAPAENADSPTPAVAVDMENDPGVAGQLTFKFLGNWQGDPEPFKQDPEYIKHAETAPEMVKSITDMMTGMLMTVTMDGITMDVLGQKAGPFKYSVIAGSGNALIIRNEEGPKAGVQSKIVFRDDRHIQVIELTSEGRAMFFKKL